MIVEAVYDEIYLCLAWTLDLRRLNVLNASLVYYTRLTAGAGRSTWYSRAGRIHAHGGRVNMCILSRHNLQLYSLHSGIQTLT